MDHSRLTIGGMRDLRMRIIHERLIVSLQCLYYCCPIPPPTSQPGPALVNSYCQRMSVAASPLFSLCATSLRLLPMPALDAGRAGRGLVFRVATEGRSLGFRVTDWICRLTSLQT